jgi:hypothetical protein
MISFADGFPPQTHPPKPTTRRRRCAEPVEADKPPQPKATPICTSSIRHRGFIRGHLPPTDTPTETHIPPHGQSPPSRSAFHLLIIHSSLWFFIRGRFSPTDTPAETHNPPHGQPPPPRSHWVELVETTPICTSSIRHRGFHIVPAGYSWTVSPWSNVLIFFYSKRLFCNCFCIQL